MHLRQEQRPAEAVALWERLLPQLDESTAAELRVQVDQARAAAGMPPRAPAQSGEPDAGPGLDVEVAVAPALAAQAGPGTVLFVFARALEGGGPPLAAKRIELGQLPVRVRLTDADSPMPAAKLSSQKEVLLVARLSRSGDVRAASGDLEAEPVKVATDGGATTRVLLDRAVP